MSREPIESFIHEIKSMCASFSGAAELLCTVSNKEREELLELIEQNARRLAQLSGQALVDQRKRLQDC